MKELEIFNTQDGSHSVFSPTFGVSYHSKYGAIQESQHVFIAAGLLEKASTQKDISILEIGWGTGLNALMTLVEAERRQLTIHYTGVENYPLSLEEASALNYPEELEVSEKREVFEEMHRMPWGEPQTLSPNFSFTKLRQKFQDLTIKDSFDVIYFDAFSPSAQPELWETAVLGIMYDALKTDGILVTYCAKGAVKRALKSLGFSIEALPGPPGKREMTRAKKAEAVKPQP
jgi:tRNA U34 5-methylaminomethyl-2-thiouridine-forming methyltransferase MnmC